MHGPLGRAIPFPSRVDPRVLFAIPRSQNRKHLSTASEKLFDGHDLWNCYELSWLSAGGIPKVALLQLNVPCHSPNLIESKSLKLFLGGFNNTFFSSVGEVKDTIASHLCKRLGIDSLSLELYEPNDWELELSTPEGECIDTLQDPEPTLQVSEEIVEQALHSNLLRTVCPVTEQPDFGTVEVFYAGRKIIPNTLLGFIIKLRNHKGFHEEVCESIFCDIQSVAQCSYLQVQCSFTRRGGMDINPVRFSYGSKPKLLHRRLIRQ